SVRRRHQLYRPKSKRGIADERHANLPASSESNQRAPIQVQSSRPHAVNGELGENDAAAAVSV
ncbi:MAG: hypothetical protein ACK557_04895, partial [Planctomycetota bacterium]